jgi:hypothetical protein
MQIKGVVQGGFARSDVMWLRNMAQAGTRQRCGEKGFIQDKADGFVSARIIHDEGGAQPQRKV